MNSLAATWSPLLGLALLAPLAGPILAGDAPALATELVVDGLDQPVFVTAPPRDPRLFVLEQNTAHVQLVKDGACVVYRSKPKPRGPGKDGGSAKPEGPGKDGGGDG